MAEKKKAAEAGSARPAGAEDAEAYEPLQEGRFGAAWFVMLSGLLLVMLFFLALIFNNVIMIKDVLDRYMGPSAWVLQMAPWLANNSLLMIIGSTLYIAGYSMTLRRKGRSRRDRLMLRLFGVGTGVVSLALLVLGLDYVFFLPKEISGLSQHLDMYGVQLCTFLAFSAVLGAVTVYCWMPRGGGRDGGGA